MAWRKNDKLDEMRLDRAKAKEAATAIRDAFIWDATREGGDYWYRVVMRLEAFAKAKASMKVEAGAEPKASHP
jgi:hypothetical protein